MGTRPLEGKVLPAGTGLRAVSEATEAVADPAGREGSEGPA
jgi:hypothetical protein